MMLARLPYAVAAAVGVGLLVITFAFSQLSASSAADDVAAAGRVVATKSRVGQMRVDLERVKASADAIDAEGLPRLASLSGQTQSEFLADLRAQDTAVTEALDKAPGIVALGEKVVSNLDRHQDEIRSAEKLPGLGLKVHDAAVARLVLAAVLVLLGVAGLLRPRLPIAGAVFAIGAALVLTPLALGYPAKTADADAGLDALRPFSMEKVQAREEALATLRTLFEGFSQDVVPSVAGRAGITPAAAAAELERASPQLSQASFDELGAALSRFDKLAAISRGIQPRLAESDELSAAANMWLVIGGGLALVLAGGLALVQIRKTAGG